MTSVDFKRLSIPSPKRRPRTQPGWHGFFPYYAGFPEEFACTVLSSASLSDGSVVLDPWNGSGTTTYAASKLGLDSIASDLNPVMLVVAKARLLDPNEADHIEPQARQVIERARGQAGDLALDDPLLTWFTYDTATTIRSIEATIREKLVGSLTRSADGVRLERLSGTAATFYVALFTICREFSARFRSSNPTWIRRPREHEERISVTRDETEARLRWTLGEMAGALAIEAERVGQFGHCRGRARMVLGDTASGLPFESDADLVIASPPYCTRIDYTAATRVELAVLSGLCGGDFGELSRRMIGSTRVPGRRVLPSDAFGPTCRQFLSDLRAHPSKASATYYYRTHVDYFWKMARSLRAVRRALRPGGGAVIVVQDSFYKDLHNDLPKMFEEMGERCGLRLERREDFPIARTMAGVNPRTRIYRNDFRAVEVVLCFSTG